MLRRASILYGQDLAREIEADEKPDDRAPMKKFPPTAGEAKGQLLGSQIISYDSDPNDRPPIRRSPSSSVIADDDRDWLPDSYYNSDAGSSIRKQHVSRIMHPQNKRSRARHSPSLASMARLDLIGNETAKRSQLSIAQPDEQSVKNERSQSLPDTLPQKTTAFPPAPTQDRRATVEDYGEPEKPGNVHRTSDHGTTAPPGNTQRLLSPFPKREPQSQDARQDSEDWETFHESTRRPSFHRPSFHDYPPAIAWRWLSQMDIIPGYWATPWFWSDPDLYTRYCKGTISVVLEALLGYLNNRNLQSVSKEHELEDFLKWALLGQSTWPIYATNARGGIVVEAHYAKVEFSGFASSMAAVKLLYDYQWQTTDYGLPGSALEEHKTAELMMLDSWLSICGRQPEIFSGRSSLLHKMPNILESLEYRFWEAFSKLDRTASEGGLQHIQQEVRTLEEFLARKRLSEAEQIFTLVAMLRTAKVAVCVSFGPDTSQIDGILESDARVWLV